MKSALCLLYLLKFIFLNFSRSYARKPRGFFCEHIVFTSTTAVYAGLFSVFWCMKVVLVPWALDVFVQSDARIGTCISVRTLRAVLRWRSHSVVCSWRPGGSADENEVPFTMHICRRGSGGMEPVTVLHPQLFIREQFQARRLWKHFCWHLISDCTLHFHCFMHRIFSVGLRFVRRHWISHRVTAP